MNTCLSLKSRNCVFDKNCVCTANSVNVHDPALILHTFCNNSRAFLFCEKFDFCKILDGMVNVFITLNYVILLTGICFLLVEVCILLPGVCILLTGVCILLTGEHVL